MGGSTLGRMLLSDTARLRRQPDSRGTTRGPSRRLLGRDQIQLTVNTTAETDRPSFQLHYYSLDFSEGHMKGSKIWRSSDRNLVAGGHAPLDSCNKRFYCKMRSGCFSPTIPLHSRSRVHLGNFIFTAGLQPSLQPFVA